MAGQVAPTPTQPPFVARPTSVGQAGEGPPSSTAPAPAPLSKVAPYLSASRTAPTVGQLWPRGNRQS